MLNEKYDLVVLGGGPGGYVAAIRAAQLGLSVAVIEKEQLGGICLNWGCIPTKAMLKSAEVFSTLKKSNEYGVSATNINFDLQKIVDRSSKIAAQLSAGVEHLLTKHKVKIIRGVGTLKPNNTVKVSSGEQLIEMNAANVILATGARARELKGLESDGRLIWNYKHALRPKRMPKKMLVVGSGAIGVEFSSFYNSLGCDVTIMELFERILPNEDKDISEFAKKEFKNKGIKILEKATIQTFKKNKHEVDVKIKIEDKVQADNFDTIIVAAGIIGNTENIGLEKLGVSVENFHITTNEFCETNVKNIYAIGDVAAAPWLAHKASHEGIMVVEKIAGLKVQPIKENTIAGCTFCEPQIASIGLTEEKALKEGYSIRVGKFPFIGNGKALAIGNSNGLSKTIFDSKTGELLGAHLIGPEVTELIHSFALGKQIEGIDQDFIETIFPHPTLSEAIHESVLNSIDRTLHY